MTNKLQAKHGDSYISEDKLGQIVQLDEILKNLEQENVIKILMKK